MQREERHRHSCATTTGSQTWAGLGSYLFEINNATGAVGADPGWDLLTGSGVLNVTATFRGTTTVNGGTLQFAKASSIYAGVTTDWVKTKITVNNGATIAFNVGGTNEFTAGNLATLLSGLGGSVTNNGLRAGSAIAIDTTNASGDTFTLAAAIANTTGTGGGAVGLRKIGANTLALTNPSTYTSRTIVDDGTLAGNGNFGGNVTISAGVVHSLAVASTTAGQDTSVIIGTLAMAESPSTSLRRQLQLPMSMCLPPPLAA